MFVQFVCMYDRQKVREGRGRMCLCMFYANYPDLNLNLQRKQFPAKENHFFFTLTFYSRMINNKTSRRNI